MSGGDVELQICPFQREFRTNPAAGEGLNRPYKRVAGLDCRRNKGVCSDVKEVPDQEIGRYKRTPTLEEAPLTKMREL